MTAVLAIYNFAGIREDNADLFCSVVNMFHSNRASLVVTLHCIPCHRDKQLYMKLMQIFGVNSIDANNPLHGCDGLLLDQATSYKIATLFMVQIPSQ